MTNRILLMLALGILNPLLSNASTATVSFASADLASITDKNTTSPFSAVTVSDSESGIEIGSVVITCPGGHGVWALSLGGGYALVSNNPTTYHLTKNNMDASEAQTGLRAIDFSPVENRIPMGTVETNAFTVTVTDASNSSDNATVTLPVTPANDAPIVSLPPSIAGIADTNTCLPFASIDIQDVDSNDTVTVAVSFPDIRGTLATAVNFTKEVVGPTATYTLSAMSVQSAEAFLKTNRFTPQPNRILIGSTETTTFTCVVTDAAAATDSDTVSVQVTPINDRPVFSGSMCSLVNDNANTNLFSGFILSDVDNSGTQTVVAVATIGGGGGESLVAAFSNDSGLVSSVAFTNMPGNLGALLNSLVFSPTPNRRPVGLTETVAVSVVVFDIEGKVSLSNFTNNLAILSINDPPTLLPTVTQTPIPDTESSHPFSVFVEDVDLSNNYFSVSVVPTNSADFACGNFSPTNVFTGTLEDVSQALFNLTYEPVVNSVAGSRLLTFRFTATDANGGTASAISSVTIQGQNDPPSITGITPDVIHTTDDPSEPPVHPFSSVQISDPDIGQGVTVVLTVDDASKGAFSQTTLSGTVDAVSTALRAVTFAALIRPGRVMGATINATLTITATDSGGAVRANSGTIIAITSVNGAPQILGVPAIQPVLIAPAPPIRPFAGMWVTDDQTNAVTVTVTLDDAAKGVLSNLNGFLQTVPGTYRMIDSYAAVSAALSNLAFEVSGTYVFPANAPGGTVFTIRALDSVLNLATKTVSIILQYAPRNILVTRTTDDVLPGSLRYAVANCENNGFITFALPTYPAIIRLSTNLGPISIEHNANFRGPGADRMTVSGDWNGDGTPDTQLFRIGAVVSMEGLTLAKGRSADTGGACYVGSGGALTLRYCAVVESVASQWGGAIDVEEGALVLENCLIRSNATSQALGLGGGGVSLYTDEPCSLLNTTFAGNRQQASSGVAGGALYVENLTPSTALLVEVKQCTFAENADAVGSASSIMALGFGTYIYIGNSIFMDGRGRNLGVDAAAEIVSAGGSLSDDSTQTTLINGGVPEEVILLNEGTDRTNVAAGVVLEMPLATDLQPTAGYRLKSGSPAIGHATAPVAAVDQLGVIRDSAPDSGAIEKDMTARLVLNEIQFDPASGQPAWLELYVPRESSPVDLGGLQLLVDGVTNHTFASPLVVQPGHGLVVADTNGTITLSPPSNPIPVVRPGLAPMNIRSAGRVEIVNPARRWNPIQAVRYLGVFADPVSPTQTLATVHNSITLAPQFSGRAFAPHSLVLTPPQGGVDMTRSTAINLCSPGSDTSPMEFGSRNAQPQAQNDRIVVGEDDLSSLAVLANDTDADGTDHLVVTDVSTRPGAAPDVALTNSVQGATVWLDPMAIQDAGATPKLRGASVWYDPRATPGIQSLAEGATREDTFCYTVVDIGSGVISAFGSAGPATVVTSAGHRLTNNEEIVISGCDVTNYCGLWAVTWVNDDEFSIPVAFGTPPATNGSWVTRHQRQATTPSQATVTVQLLGANDPPVPVTDQVPADEDTVLRIMGDPELAGATGLVFVTDADYPVPPVISPVCVLTNDWDIDTDDNASTLNLVGILSHVHAITNFEGAVGVSPVTVRSPAHGLSEGAVILLSGYAGHPSYNGYRTVSVVDSNTFTIPVLYVDNAAVKGVWGVLTDTGRLAAASSKGASVRLDLRAQRAETSIIYDPTHSLELNHLAVGETATDTFFYAISDRHGAVSIGTIEMLVAGRNDSPVVVPDPGALTPLGGWPGGGSLPDLLPGLSVVYALSPASGLPQHADVRVQLGTNGTPWVSALTNLWMTDEDTPVSLVSSELLGNDSDVDLSDVLIIAGVPAVTHEGATLTLTSNSVAVIYDPTTSSNLNCLARNEYRIDSFSAVISDQNGGVVTSLVAVLVAGRDDSPVAHNDTAAVFENQTLMLGPDNGVLTNDVELDIDGTLPDNRRVLIDRTNTPTQIPDAWVMISNNTVYYDPSGSAFLEHLAAGQTYPDTINYTMMDGSFVFANPDFFCVRTGSSNVVLDVLSNDRNFTGSGGALRITGITSTSQGGLCVMGAGATNLIYTPSAAFVGDEVVTYMIDDGKGNNDRAQILIRVTVNRLNGVVQVNPDFFSVAKGESVALDVLANDNVLPETGTTLTILGLVGTPSQGGQAVLTTNRFTFTPDPGYGGSYPYTEAFSYVASGGGSSLATGHVDVVVVDREGVLEVRDDTFSVDAGSLGTPLDILLNDDILPGLPVVLTIKEVGPVAQGQVTVDGDGRGVTYVPPLNYIGPDTFSYVATDGCGGTGVGTVTLSVGILTACGDTFVVTNLGSAAELDVLANDTLLQETVGANLTIGSVSPTNTALGPLSIKSGGKRLVFTPSQTGELDCTYTVTDGSGRSAAASAHCVVMTNGIKANPDVYAVLQDSIENRLTVLRNDATVPAQGKTLVIVSIGTGLEAPNHSGVVTVAPDGLSLMYTPQAGFSGEETFTYTMTDSVLTDKARVTVKVSRGELIANPDLYSVYLMQPVPGEATNAFVLPVTVNDLIIPDFGQAISIVALGNGTNAPNHNGKVTIGADGQTLTYVPSQTNWLGGYTERFTYEISDGTAWRDEGVVSVRVLNRTNAVDIACQDDAFAVERDSLNNALSVLDNDGVKPATTTGWTLSGVTISEIGGVVSVNGGKLRYSPPAGFVGVDHFSYSVKDGFGGTGTASVTVRISGLTLNADVFSAISGSAGNELDVLLNDPLQPGTNSNYHLIDVGGATMGGTVWIATGKVMYAPAAGYIGPWPYTEDFTYRAADDSGVMSTGRVSVAVYRDGADRSHAVLHVTVVGVNDPPVITGTVSGQRYFLQGIAPFPGVVISDVDNFGAELQTVTVALEHPEHGALGSLGAFTVVSNGVVRLSGVTPTAAGAALRQLVFTPSMAPEGAGAGRVTRLSITVWDGTVSVTDTNTTLIDSPPIEGLVTPSLAVSNANFGSAVAATSNMVISAMASDMSNGVSYVSAIFLAGSAGGGGVWSPTGKVMSVDYQTNGVSGASVALDGDVLVVGAPMAVTGLVRTGTAYVYYRHQGGSNKWGVVRRLTASDGAADDAFGNAVAISGNTLVVGAFHDNWNSSQNGSVSIFSRNQGGADQWGLVKKIALGDGTTGDFYGSGVAINGDTLAVGSPMRDDMGFNSGTVYLYMRDAGGTNQWGQILKKYAPDAAVSNEFGTAVAMVGDMLAVGAPGESQGGTNSGAVYLFSRHEGGTNQWGQIKKIRPRDGASRQEFGCSVGLDSNSLAVGARNDLVNGARKGSAYLYARSYTGLETWGFVRKFAAAAGAAGDEYGQAISVGGGVLAVGARYHGVPVYRCGATYIYTFKYNNAPVVTDPVPNQMAVVGSPFGLVLSPTAFTDTDFGSVITLSADYSMSPGLGAWLSFDPVTGSFSGVPALPGTNTVRVLARDNEGASATNSFLLTVITNTASVARSTPLAQWQRLFFGDAALADAGQESTLWGDQADSDGDGIPNLTEYMFGSNPRIADVSDPSRITLSPLSGTSQWVTISFKRRSSDWYLTYSLEASSDLILWQPVGALVLGESQTPLLPGVAWVTQDVLIPGGLMNHQFYRLRVSINE